MTRTRTRYLATILATIVATNPLYADVNRATFAGGGGGVALSGTNAWTGANSFWDTLFTVIDNTDNTKKIAFEASGITTGTTRTLTVPDGSGTLPLLNRIQTFTAKQTFTNVGDFGIFVSSDTFLGFSGAGGDALIGWVPAQTPDTVYFGTSVVSNSLVIGERGDYAFDFAHPLQTNPTLFGHSAAQSTTQWWGLTHDGTNGVWSTGVGAAKIASASGAIISTGSAPTVSACGTTPSTVAGSATAGRFTTGSGGVATSCTLTFVPALVAAPSCTCNNESTLLLVRAVATATTLVCDVALAASFVSQVITYQCLGGV